MIVDVECPRCCGIGELMGSAPSRRSRYVGYDDLDYDDYGYSCPKCGGSGTVDYDPEDEVEDWMTGGNHG